jgi:hypothetical protein
MPAGQPRKPGGGPDEDSAVPGHELPRDGNVGALGPVRTGAYGFVP